MEKNVEIAKWKAIGANFINKAQFVWKTKINLHKNRILSRKTRR